MRFGPWTSKDVWISDASCLILALGAVIVLGDFPRCRAFALGIAFLYGAEAIVHLMCSMGTWRYRKQCKVTGQAIQNTHVFRRVFGGFDAR